MQPKFPSRMQLGFENLSASFLIYPKKVKVSLFNFCIPVQILALEAYFFSYLIRSIIACPYAWRVHG